MLSCLILKSAHVERQQLSRIIFALQYDFNSIKSGLESLCSLEKEALKNESIQ